LKFHYSGSGEREITVFKTLDSPTQISVVLWGASRPGFSDYENSEATQHHSFFNSEDIQRHFDFETGTRGSLTPLPSLPFQSLLETGTRVYIEKI
jgi:hypothetical protein